MATRLANTREVGGILITGYGSKGRINKCIRIAFVEPALVRLPQSLPGTLDSVRSVGYRPAFIG